MISQRICDMRREDARAVCPLSVCVIGDCGIRCFRLSEFYLKDQALIEVKVVFGGMEIERGFETYMSASNK